MTDNIEYVKDLCDNASCSSQVPDSWCDIVADCHREMLATGIGFTVAQIKEKFGGLRFYFTSDNNYSKLEPIVRKAEQAVYDLEREEN